MTNFLLPNWIAEHQFTYDPANPPQTLVRELRGRLSRFRSLDPEISIVIPAYNEEANLLNTLSSLAGQLSACRIELIVVNNNSSDRTQELLDQCGVKSVTERQPGVAYARQAGLNAARGWFVANADADCLYPPGWVDAIVNPLRQPTVACTYGLYSFIPNEQASRIMLECYEQVSHTLNFIRSRSEPYLNVYGFNFAFRRDDALAIGGFALDSGPVGSVAELVAEGKMPAVSKKGEDGWMALSLMREGKGTICRVTSTKAHVWTSVRRLVAHGSLGDAFTDRLNRTVKGWASGLLHRN
ncbi:glycosyltransferase family 2 protein [Spirosoma rigui]|uniref:glycosyltransferase family 2 protein n=1 Tax=Spirosoma rigui TaxID=564064 RepID=UPI0009B04846|nr:glycosyltransferase family 2 protein [Spirosoma rigui]